MIDHSIHSYEHTSNNTLQSKPGSDDSIVVKDPPKKTNTNKVLALKGRVNLYIKASIREARSRFFLFMSG